LNGGRPRAFPLYFPWRVSVDVGLAADLVNDLARRSILAAALARSLDRSVGRPTGRLRREAIARRLGANEFSEGAVRAGGTARIPRFNLCAA